MTKNKSSPVFPDGELFVRDDIVECVSANLKLQTENAFYFPAISKAVAMASTSSFSRAAACRVSRRLALTQ